MRNRLRLVSGLWLVLIATPASAHDMWIEPSTFTPPAGEIVPIRLRVGQGLVGDPIPRDPQLMKDFVVEDAAGRRPVVGRDGQDPAGFVRPAAPGLLVVGYQSHPSIVAMTSEKFTQYLNDEGLDTIAAERARRGQTAAGARDQFTRCAKGLIVAAGGSGTLAADRRLGFELELIAERSPYASGDIPIQLIFRGRPLINSLVVAINRLHPNERLAARTDASGHVRFHFTHGTTWLVKSVHMIQAPDPSIADWASYWASLTFEPPLTAEMR